VKIKVKHECKQ